MTTDLDIPCPGHTCGAPAGEPCRTSGGQPRAEPHGLRWLNAQAGPLVRCPDGPCDACHWTAWTPESIVCMDYPDCQREHAGGAGGVPVHPPAGSRISGDEPLPDLEPAPTYQPGDVAIATVLDIGVRDNIEVHWDGKDWWEFPPDGGVVCHDTKDIEVTSRAIVVTEADRDELIATVSVEYGWADWYAKKIRRWFDALRGGESNG